MPEEPLSRTTKYTPFVPEETDQREFTLRAVGLGVVLAAILGAANAYAGLKVGMTISAAFPAAVIAMAFLRLFRGGILEENIARTTASVGEALVAGAIFTIPAFILVGAWNDFFEWGPYLEGSFMLLVGGVLGVLFVVVLRRALVAESDLPFPEAVAAAAIHKSGQKGATGAGLVFGSMGIAMLIQLFRDNAGIHLIRDTVTGFWGFAKSKVMLTSAAGETAFQGQAGIWWTTPKASPMLMGVGYVIGPRLAAINFAGGVLAWGLLVPLLLFLNGPDGQLGAIAQSDGWATAAGQAWGNFVKPAAVGAMLVGALYTLFSMRKQLMSGIGKAMADLRAMKAGTGRPSRHEHDLPLTVIGLIIVLMVIPTGALYGYFTHDVLGGLVTALVMVAASFLFCAVAGYLVGIVGSSSNPISGLTLSTLIVAALLMVVIGQKGPGAVAAVLGVATVVCCACGIGGDMIQDLKVGHILGGTPWRMQVAEMISVVIVAFILIAPIGALHAADIKLGGSGIGSAELPAPQAGLMAMLSQGIIGGQMAWLLVVAGMFFSVGLILIKAPSPMLIAIGMYLPLHTTAAIFIGGIIRWLSDWLVRRRGASSEQLEAAGNKGILVASGLIAGQALTGVILAFYVIISDSDTGIASIAEEGALPIVCMVGVFILTALMLIIPAVKHVPRRGTKAS